eukprot:ctg_256.g148
MCARECDQPARVSVFGGSCGGAGGDADTWFSVRRDAVGVAAHSSMREDAEPVSPGWGSSWWSALEKIGLGGGGAYEHVDVERGPRRTSRARRWAMVLSTLALAVLLSAVSVVLVRERSGDGWLHAEKPLPVGAEERTHIQEALRRQLRDLCAHMVQRRQACGAAYDCLLQELLPVESDDTAGRSTSWLAHAWHRWWRSLRERRPGYRAVQSHRKATTLAGVHCAQRGALAAAEHPTPLGAGRGALSGVRQRVRRQRAPGAAATGRAGAGDVSSHRRTGRAVGGVRQCVTQLAHGGTLSAHARCRGIPGGEGQLQHRQAEYPREIDSAGESHPQLRRAAPRESRSQHRSGGSGRRAGVGTVCRPAAGRPHRRAAFSAQRGVRLGAQTDPRPCRPQPGAAALQCRAVLQSGSAVFRARMDGVSGGHSAAARPAHACLAAAHAPVASGAARMNQNECDASGNSWLFWRDFSCGMQSEQRDTVRIASSERRARRWESMRRASAPKADRRSPLIPSVADWRQWCRQELSAAAVRRGLLLQLVHVDHRGGLQDQVHPARRRQGGEAANMGHGGAGAVSDHHLVVLPGRARHHHRVRRDRRRELPERQHVGVGDRALCQ